MAKDFDLEDFNMIDMQAKKVLVILSEFDTGLLVKGELLHKKTGLTPESINYSVRNLAKSMLIDIADKLRDSPPYEFYAVEITDFGRQVLQQFG